MSSQYEYKEVSFENEVGEINLASILSIERKRTFFIKLVGDHDFCLSINNIKINSIDKEVTSSMIQPVADATYMSFPTKYEEINKDNPMQFIGQKKKIKINASANTALKLTYYYILDINSKKKVKEVKPLNDEDEMQNQMTNEQKEEWCQAELTKANKIYAEVSQSWDNDEFNKLTDEQKLSHYRGKYPNFNKRHPLCMRYMVDIKKFSSIAFEKYIKRVANSKFGDQDQFMQRQADYVTFLWQIDSKKHYGDKDKRKVWENAYNLIKSETEKLKSQQDLADEIAEEMTSKYRHKHIEEIHTFIKELQHVDIKEVLPITNHEERLREFLEKEYQEGESSEDEAPSFSNAHEHTFITHDNI